ncbi:MAG: Crp/Fnr family transcriptional regulator [Glycocaulis sp.]
MPPPDQPVTNRILAALPASTLDALRPELKPVRLSRGTVINEFGSRIDHIFFIARGLVSLVKTMADGRMVEIGAIGPEGVTGVNALFDIGTALIDTVVQLPGEAHRIPVSRLLALMKVHPSIHGLLEACVHTALNQITHTAACNRLHTSEERCCRWLLMCNDAALSDEFQLTQEFLSVMLGVRRVSVTHIAGDLQRAGIIRYHRGTMTIVDREALERRACECYDAVRSAYEDMLVRKAPSGL